jgi:hypothetical protein
MVRGFDHKQSDETILDIVCESTGLNDVKNYKIPSFPEGQGYGYFLFPSFAEAEKTIKYLQGFFLFY